MKNFLTKATAALALAGALVATAPAQAQPGGYGGGHSYRDGGNYGARGYYGRGYHDGYGGNRGRHWRHGDDDAGLAIGAGIIGLALGAAIASDHSSYDDRYYSGRRGYYDGYGVDGGYGGYDGYDYQYPGYGYGY